MPLPPSKATRQKKHTRNITIEGFQRDDGLWELEGTVTDVKTFDAKNAFRMRPAGDYHHKMHVRLVVDMNSNVLDVEAASDANPHEAQCRIGVPDYTRLVGLNLKRGFRKGVKERMGGTQGCTHINELLGVMPTGFFQSVAGTVETLGDEKRMAMVFDTCTAWNRSGNVVKQHFPQWYIADRQGDLKPK